MNRIIYKSNKGFTLVELLVAVTLLVMAAAAFLPVFTLVSRSNNQNNIRATANAIAAGIFEELSSMDYDKVGTEGGNPPGDIPKFRQIPVDNVIYDVETRITWGSTEDTNNKTDNLAFKNVRVIVSAVNTFTGNKETVDKMYSIVAKEGGKSLPDKGNIRAIVKQADVLGHEFPVVNISCNGPESYTMPTNEEGQVIFGMIEKGVYNVSTTLPSGWMAPQDDITGSTITRSDILVDSWKVRDVYFYMDKPEKFCWLSVKFVDEFGNEIDIQGKLTITWEIDGEKRILLNNKDFSGVNLDPAFIGRLWPLGTYNIRIDFPYGNGLKNYDMSNSNDKPYIEGTSEVWTGTFNNYGETLNIVIPIKSGLNTRDAYSKIEAESFDSKSRTISTERCNDVGGTENLTSISKNNYTIYEHVNFKDDKPYTFQARVSAQEEGRITIRLDNRYGPVIGTLWVNPTGADTYKTVSCVITDQNIMGVRTVCLVFEPGLGLKVNWFKFSKVLDDFNDNKIDYTRWSFSGGKWEEEGGYLKQKSKVIGDNRKAILNNSEISYKDHYTIIGKVRADEWYTKSDNPRAGLSLFAGFEDDNSDVYSLDFYNSYWRRNWYIYRGIMANNTQTTAIERFDGFDSDSWYWFMFSSNKIGNKVRFSGKIWPVGDVEPDWQYSWEENNIDFIGYPALNSGSGNCIVWFDDISVINNDCTE